MKKTLIMLFIVLNSMLVGQSKDTFSSEDLSFKPSFAGAQFEVTTLIYVSEFGALLDIDLLKTNSKTDYSFGTRLSFESYSYFEPGGPTGGGPFKDYCFYLRHSARSKKFHFNIMLGFSYHTRKNPNYEPDKILFRPSVELRYNLLEKMAGIILKGATSFDKRTTYIGLGIAIGYYK